MSSDAIWNCSTCGARNVEYTHMCDITERLLAAVRRLVDCPDLQVAKLSPESLKAIEDGKDAMAQYAGKSPRPAVTR